MTLVEMTSVSAGSPQRYYGVTAAMHRDRKRVFVDSLGWKVPVVGGEFEIDQFDDEHATYLVVADGADPRRHLGSVRLLSSEREHILGDIFPELCDGEVPRGPDVMEITRLCIAPDAGGVRAGMNVRRQLAIGLTEYALLHDIRTYTLVCVTQHLPQVLAVGWDVEPLGLPVLIDGQMLCAARINITPATLSLLRSSSFTRAERPARTQPREAVPLAA